MSLYSIMCTFITCVLLLSNEVKDVKAWDSDDLELFDLVEEINENFYTFLQIEQSSDVAEVKKAYRRLSLVWHPDKSDATDASTKFRQLRAIYEVLRDETRRKKYDDVLENGLPSWHQPVFYYRRVRKMGIIEFILLLVPIITVIQYAVLWAAYWEKKYELEETVLSKFRRSQKKAARKGKQEKSVDVSSIDDIIYIPKPSCFNLLPFQTVRFIWTAIISIPLAYETVLALFNEWQEKRKQNESEDESDDNENKDRVRTARKRRTFQIPELEESETNGIRSTKDREKDFSSQNQSRIEQNSYVPPVSGGLWTDDDLADLVRLMKKYPQGVSERWERIAESMGRTVAEVTFMSKKLREDSYRLNVPLKAQGHPAGLQPLEDGEELDLTNGNTYIVEEKAKKPKTRGGKLGKLEVEDASDVGGDVREDSWGQIQQKSLESALVQFPKGTLDRWDRIAKCVPDKTKEECMLRYKELVQHVKKKKGGQEKAQATSESSTQML